MRVSYYTPLPHHYDTVFNFQENNFTRGGGLQDISVYKRRGGSLFGILRGVFKRSIPFLKRYILPEIGSLVKNVSHDVSQNVPLRDTLKANTFNSLKNVGSRIVRGAGQKVKKHRKRKFINTKKKKKSLPKKSKKQKKHCAVKRKKDIFDSEILSI